MLFPTVEFAVFFLLTFLAAAVAAPWPRARKGILLVASYIFYGWWDARFTLLLFECTMVNWVVGLALDDAVERAAAVGLLPSAVPRCRWLLRFGIVFNLFVLGLFKYWGFFASSLVDGLRLLGLSPSLKIVEVVLPVGISFYTFQGISYLMDISRREIRAVHSLLDMLLFKAFFPQLVAGPIVRAQEFLPQLAADQAPARGLRAGRAFYLIGLGLFKKVIIAHYLAVDLVNPAFESPKSYGSTDLLIAVYGYSVQIYADFSAYSDMAIGVALLFGYEFPLNFDQPYRATSLREFWHRWHMSLSRFLRDYLYIPLGGSRGGPLRTYRNLILTFLLGGLWHGAAWNFVIWGLLHGVGLVVERVLNKTFTQLVPRSWHGPLRLPRALIGLFFTFHFVCLAWIFFNSDSSAIAFEYVRAMIKGAGEQVLLTPLTIGLVALGLGTQFLPARWPQWSEWALTRLPLPVQAAALAGLVVMVACLGPGSLAPFIYFKF